FVSFVKKSFEEIRFLGTINGGEKRNVLGASHFNSLQCSGLFSSNYRTDYRFLSGPTELGTGKLDGSPRSRGWAEVEDRSRSCAIEPCVSRYRPGRAPACFLERCGAARSPFSRLRSPFRSAKVLKSQCRVVL